jgi:hypothetical protein
LDILKTLTEKLKEACDESIEHGIYGTSRDHIESIKRLPDEDGAFMFEVTYWIEESENSRRTKKLGLIQIMDLMASFIAERATRLAVSSFKD